MGRMGGAWLWARAQWRRRWRALVALTLMLGLLGAAALTFVAGARRSASSYQRFRRTSVARDLSMQTSGDEGRALLERALLLPGVRAGAVLSGYPAFTDIKSEFDFGILAPVDGRYGAVIDRPIVLEGRGPHPDRVDEVAINPVARDRLRAHAGDTITLSTLTPEEIANLTQFSGTPGGPHLRLHVTGVLRTPDDLTGDVATATVLATPAFERAYASRVGRYANLAAVRLKGGSRSVAAFEEEVHRLAGDAEVQVTGAARAGKEVNSAVRLLGGALALMGVALFLAGLVAGGQALSRQLWAGAADQPVLAVLGLTRRQRIAAQVVVAAPVAIASALLAAAGALLASPLMPVNLARQAEPRPGLSFDAVVLFAGAAAMVGLVFAGAALSAWRLAAVAGRDEGWAPRPSQITSLVLRLGSRPSAVTGVSFALDPGRGSNAVPVRPALAGAALGIAGLVAAFTFGGSLDRLVQTPARYGTAWDLSPDLGPDDATRAAAMAEVGDVGVLHVSSVHVGGHTAASYSLAALKGTPDFPVLGGRTPRATGEVALGPDQFQRLRVRIGDRISVEGRAGVRRMRVVGKVLLPGTDESPVSSGVVIGADDHQQLGESEGSDQAVIAWAAGTDPARAERRFRSQFPNAVSAYSRPRPPGNVANLNRVAVLPRALGGLLAVIALVATGHALVTSVRRRRNDLAILRTLGFVRGQVAGTVAWQSTTLALVGVVVGLPLGLVVGRWTWTLVAHGVGVAPDALVPAVVFLAVPGAIVAANLLAGLPGLQASKVRPASVLRAE